MKSLRTALIVVALSTVSASASDSITAKDLARACDDGNGRAGDIDCSTFVRAYLDGVGAGQAIQLRSATNFCPPKGGITTDRGRKIIAQHFRTHPEQLADEAGLSAMLALLEAFPCKSQSVDRGSIKGFGALQ